MFVGPGGCVVLDLEALVLCALFLPGAMHPPVQRPSSLFAYVFCAVLAVIASCHLRVKLSCIYRLPACLPPQQPGFQSKSLLQLTSSGRRKQACRLWCLSTNLSPTSLGAGPRLLLCMVPFFPIAAPAGLWPDIGITCSGSSLWHYSPRCQHIFLLPSFSDPKVFSLIDVFFL